MGNNRQCHVRSQLWGGVRFGWVEEVESQEWAEKYRPDIEAKWDQLYKKPEYNPLEK